MLTRQKIILALLSRANKPLSPTVFVKLTFLLRRETDLRHDPTFYDFVPYKYGPFSFALYREIAGLRRDGYLAADEGCMVLSESALGLANDRIVELPVASWEAVEQVTGKYGGTSQTELLKDVYSRYPWYATRSELMDIRPKPSSRVRIACPAVYTVGYEGRSVDAFFDHLLLTGIKLIIDVRANPISRRYGFSKKQFSGIAHDLGIDYQHVPGLGIPSEFRLELSDFNSYQRLLNRYEEEMLPMHQEEIDAVGKLMTEVAAVLVCVEKDVRCCHRSRLAAAVSRRTGLEIKHI